MINLTTQQKVRNSKNESIECCRLIASICVVFLHYKFPGNMGAIIEGLARFAVPFFFIISGFFSYQANAKTIQRRLVGVTRLNIIATLFYLLWGSYKVRYIQYKSRMEWLKVMFSSQKLSAWFLLNINPLYGHLWYLSAVMVCYCLMYVYTKWTEGKIDYRPLYYISITLYVMQIALGSFATAVGWPVPYKIYRNALFFGMPMFSLGIFLREYQEKIILTYQLSKVRLLLLMLLGACFTTLQRLGVGITEMPVGSLISVISLMLLLVTTPKLAPENGILTVIISRLGRLSTYIYVTHPFWQEIYKIYLLAYVNALVGESMQRYLTPIIIAVISISTGVFWDIFYTLLCHILPTASENK